MSAVTKWNVSVDYKYADVGTCRTAVATLLAKPSWTRISVYANADGSFGSEFARVFTVLNDAFTWITSIVTEAWFTGVKLAAA